MSPSLLESIKPILERKGIDGQAEVDVSTVWERVKAITMALWSMTTRRMRMLGALVLFL